MAVKDSDIILIVTPAFAHKSIAEQISPYLTEDHIIILNPGRTFGSVEFLRTIQKQRGNIPIIVGETQTLLFTCRELKGNQVNIIKIKNSVNFSTYPDKYTDLIYEVLRDVFPQLVPIDDYLEVTLNNIGMLLHPALSLFNAGPIDCGKEFKFYKEGATPQICQVLEEIQVELNGIFRILGLKQIWYDKWAEKCYGICANSVYDAIQKVDAYKNIYAPTELVTRYFTEDVPTGLVPIASIGKFLGINTPTIDSIIHLSSIICGINFRKKGRTIQNLQLESYLKERLTKMRYLGEGFIFEDEISTTKSEDT
jgi:opine dehydrogenase